MLTAASAAASYSVLKAVHLISTYKLYPNP